MKATLANILKEHERGMMHVTFMGDAAERMYLNGVNQDDLEVISNSVKYISTELRMHCISEETKVYPGLNNYVPSYNIHEMLYEHGRIWESVEKLKTLLLKAQAGDNPEDFAIKVKIEIKAFLNLFSGHIKKENSYLYMMASHTLTLKDLNQVFRNWKEK